MGAGLWSDPERSSQGLSCAVAVQRDQRSSSVPRALAVELSREGCGSKVGGRGVAACVPVSPGGGSWRFSVVLLILNVLWASDCSLPTETTGLAPRTPQGFRLLCPRRNLCPVSGRRQATANRLKGWKVGSGHSWGQ